MSDGALRLALDQDEQTKGAVYTGHGISCYCRGLFDEAVSYLEKEIVLFEKVDNYSLISVSSLPLGEI